MLPFVSVCTPTFNRRPYIPLAIKCFEHQTYPRDRMEWLIVDDGTDPVGDLLQPITGVRYIRLEERMSLGRKRNFINGCAKGDILVYMDDDDYYPPERVAHAVDTILQNPSVELVGSSLMHIYFRDTGRIFVCGPYGQSHATAATLAFRREFLLNHRYDDDAELAEERVFLSNFTEPLVQLDTDKTILVLAHKQSSMAKDTLLGSPLTVESTRGIKDYIPDAETRRLFLEDVAYEPGNIEHKPTVVAQYAALKAGHELKVAMTYITELEAELREKNNTIHRLEARCTTMREYIETKLRSRLN